MQRVLSTAGGVAVAVLSATGQVYLARDLLFGVGLGVLGAVSSAARPDDRFRPWSRRTHARAVALVSVAWAGVWVTVGVVSGYDGVALGFQVAWLMLFAPGMYVWFRDPPEESV